MLLRYLMSRCLPTPTSILRVSVRRDRVATANCSALWTVAWESRSRPLPRRTHLASSRLPHETHLSARGVRARVRTGERAGLLSCMPLATDLGAAGVLAARLARPLGVGASAGASAISSAASSSLTLSAASTCLPFAPDLGVARRAGLLATRLVCPFGVGASWGATSSTLTNRLKLTGDGRRDEGRAGLLMERPL